MKITFTGHAGVLLSEGGVSLLCDPWMEGTAFNHSWKPYPAPRLTEDDWSRVTHIWISHEHPDHLNIPTIRAIPPALKARITLLFQKRHDRLLIDWFAAQGFHETRELPHGKPIALSPGVEVHCRQVGHTDSILLFSGRRHKVLNLNDSYMPSTALRRLKRSLGRLDVILDQFSIAGWPGNEENHAYRRASARRALDKFLNDIAILDPDYVIPFASQMRFSQRENAYANESMNTIDDVVDAVSADRLAVMYPGDAWEFDGRPFAGSGAAIARYRESWRAVGEQPLDESEPVLLDAVLAAANQRIDEFGKLFHKPVLRLMPPITFYLSDCAAAIEVDLDQGARQVRLAERDCVVSLSSQSMHFAFAWRYGLPGLGASGRFRINHSKHLFNRLKKLGSLHSAGFGSKSLAGYFVDRRKLEFLWRRKADIEPQFIQRIRLPPQQRPTRPAIGPKRSRPV